MSEELKNRALERIEDIITFLEVGIKKSGEFAVEQTPLLVQEILRFGLFENLFAFFFPLVCFLLLLYFVNFAKFYSYEEYIESESAFVTKKRSWAYIAFKDDDDTKFLPLWAVSNVLTLFAALFTLSGIGNLITAVKIIIAPRLYLIEFVGDLIK